MGKREREAQAAAESYGRGYLAAGEEVEAFYDGVREAVRTAAAVGGKGEWIDELAQKFTDNSDHILALMVRLEAVAVMRDNFRIDDDDEDGEDDA
jgi:hypothetical protein